MAEAINGIKVPFVPIVKQDSHPVDRLSRTSDSFKSIFNKELEKIKFSSHAAKRLELRNIQLDDADLLKLEDAVNRAEAKGSVDSLVLMHDTAFIVNIPNKTVVTAMPVHDESENIFTNIDSVVLT